jgi:hypothetical protein
MTGSKDANGLDPYRTRRMAQEDVMKAIVQHKYGSPEVLQLEDIDKPVVNHDEVLVRVRAAWGTGRCQTAGGR